MAEQIVKLNLRLPKKIHGQVKTRAKENERSLNAEIVMCLRIVLADSKAGKLKDLRN